MRSKLFGVVVVSLGLIAGGPLSLRAGQHGGHSGGMSMPTPMAHSVKTGKYIGKVANVDANSVTVEVNRKGQTETMSFYTTDQTKTKGNVTVGAEVKVKYREEGAQKVATSIEVKKAKGT